MHTRIENSDPRYSVLLIESRQSSGGILSLIRGDEHFKVIAEAEGDRSTIPAIELKPDITVIDLTAPKGFGTETIKEIKHCYPETRVVVVTEHHSQDYIRAALLAGTNGYVLKQDVAEELLPAMHNVVTGKTYLTPSICHKVIQEYLKRRAH